MKTVFREGRGGVRNNADKRELRLRGWNSKEEIKHTGERRVKKCVHCIVKSQGEAILRNIQLSVAGKKSNDLLFHGLVAIFNCCLCYIFHKQET